MGERAESERLRRVDARDRNPCPLSRSLLSALASRDAWVPRGVRGFPHTSFRIGGTSVLELRRAGVPRTAKGRSRTSNLACIVQVRRVGTQICFVYLLRCSPREDTERPGSDNNISAPRQGEFDIARRHFRSLLLLPDYRLVVRHLFPGRTDDVLTARVLDLPYRMFQNASRLSTGAFFFYVYLQLDAKMSILDFYS